MDRDQAIATVGGWLPGYRQGGTEEASNREWAVQIVDALGVGQPVPVTEEMVDALYCAAHHGSTRPGNYAPNRRSDGWKATAVALAAALNGAKDE